MAPILPNKPEVAKIKCYMKQYKYKIEDKNFMVFDEVEKQYKTNSGEFSSTHRGVSPTATIKL